MTNPEFNPDLIDDPSTVAFARDPRDNQIDLLDSENNSLRMGAKGVVLTSLGAAAIFAGTHPEFVVEHQDHIVQAGIAGSIIGSLVTLKGLRKASRAQRIYDRRTEKRDSLGDE
jgi:hypothetical protein